MWDITFTWHTDTGMGEMVDLCIKAGRSSYYSLETGCCLETSLVAAVFGGVYRYGYDRTKMDSGGRIAFQCEMRCCLEKTAT